jgi:hypothetical protein
MNCPFNVVSNSAPIVYFSGPGCTGTAYTYGHWAPPYGFACGAALPGAATMRLMALASPLPSQPATVWSQYTVGGSCLTFQTSTITPLLALTDLGPDSYPAGPLRMVPQ